MSGNNVKEKYLNFDEYIRQGDPLKKERARLGVWLLAYRMWMV